MAGLHDIARNAGIKDEDAQAVFEAIMAHVNAGERVVVKNFGAFFIVQSRPRLVKSPVLKRMTKETERMIPGYRYLKFKPSKRTRQTVKEMGSATIVTKGEARGTQAAPRMTKQNRNKKRG